MKPSAVSYGYGVFTVYGQLPNLRDRFVERSFVSNLASVPPSVLRTDTRYFEILGQYEIRVGFFKRSVQEMRPMEPGFGMGCYVDLNLNKKPRSSRMRAHVLAREVPLLDIRRNAIS